MSGVYVGLTVVFFILALAVCLCSYYYYTMISIKKMPIYCVVWHVIALYMCMLPFPLLVLDIDAALSKIEGGEAETQTWMRPIWIIIFTLTYFCAWVSLPVAQMYTEVGDFSVKKALVHSIKLNLKLYVVIIAVILAFFTYLLIVKGAYTSLANTLKLAISLANAWGLLMLILFMPAGLVGVPRMLWRYANPRRMLRCLLFEVMDIQENLDLAAMDLALIKAELISIDPLVAEENRSHWQQLLESISDADREIPLYHVAAQRVSLAVLPDRNDVSLEHLEALHARLKRSIKLVFRANYCWNSTLRQCKELDKIICGDRPTNNPIKKLWFPIRQYVYWMGCAVCTLLTALILWSELVVPFEFATTKTLGVIDLVMHSSLHFAWSIVLLFYMACCAYWAVFQFKVFDVYVIYPSIADNASLCFNETFLVRLLMPLCFNFLLISGFTDASSGVDVMYGHVYRRNMDVSALLGESFNHFLPLFIPFIAAIVFFNLTQRILSLIGVEAHNSNAVESVEAQQRIEEGRKLIESELGYQLESMLLSGEVEARRADGGSIPSQTNHHISCEISSPPLRGQRYREYVEKKTAQLGHPKNDDNPTVQPE